MAFSFSWLIVKFTQIKYCFQATLCEVFPQESDYEATIWKSLLITGMGLTAVATIIALNR